MDKNISKVFAVWKQNPDYGSQEITEFQKSFQELMKNVGMPLSAGLPENEEAKAAAALKRFMTMCFNRTTDFTKCDYCEFRFRCFTEVTKGKNKLNDSDDKQQKRKITKKKVPKHIIPTVFGPLPKNRRIM